MTTTTASGHWHFPGWRSLAVACAVGCLTPLAAWAANWLVHTPHSEHQRPPLILMLTMPILFAPLEEWLCRGVILRYLIRPIGVVAALLVSSAVFSLGHGLAGSPGRFVAGLGFGALYLRYRSLWPPIAAHVANNVLAVTAWLLLR